MKPAAPELAAHDAAVIDVGSNSVRLVLYRIEGRAIWTVFNEKVLAGLGRRVGDSGRLSPEGVKAALAALRRFHAVLEHAKPQARFAVATAAVRDAPDGPAFVTRVRSEAGMKIRTLSGLEEAYYAAMGVIAGQPDAEGVVGDLGGSSLELTRVSRGRPGGGVSLPLGPFALGAPGPLHLHAARELVSSRLGKVASRFRGRAFYAVGGAWRNIALIHMHAVGYPLNIVHQYEMSARDALEAARFVARQSITSLEQMPGVSRKRAETLPYAAVVLEGLVEQLGLERVCLSAFGVREGLLLEAMAPAVRRLDPLVEGCAALGVRQGVAERLGPALQSWLSPLWRGLEPLFAPGRDDILLAAASRLTDIGARLHPDHRADLTFDQVLRAPIPGQSHPERAFLATSVFARYTAQAPVRDGSGIDRVLSPERLKRARVLGAALRLGSDLSGRTPELLAGCTLAFDKGTVVLTVSRASADLLLGEQTKKRLQSLAAALDAECKIRTG